MTEPIFVSSPVDVLRGAEALAKLAQTNDSQFYIPGDGVVRVTPERWEQAQQYEHDTWLVHNLGSVSDRNDDHLAGFNGYAALPLEHGKVIELGAGAFTNVRHILSRDGSKWDSVTLLDPLIEEYRQFHPNCVYRTGGAIDPWTPVLVAKPVEGYKTKTKYDTVVMVNTLDHCYDSELVFGWIDSHLKTGGYLVFGENARDVDPMTHYDVGHPIAVTQSVLDGFLSGYDELYRNGGYFIGVKR